MKRHYLLLLSLILLFCFAASSFAAELKPTIEWEKKKGDWVATVTYKLDAKPEGEIVVRNFTGSLTFHGEPTNHELVLTYYSEERDKKEAEEMLKDTWVEVSISGSVIDVEGDRHSRWGRHRDHWKLEANLPEKFNVDAKTGGGSVSLGALEGLLVVSTGGGSISAEDLKGELDVNTGGGSIALEDIIAKVDASTGGGSIKVDDTKGDLRFKTGGGSLTLRSVAGKIDGGTGGGSISIDDVDAEFLEISTGGGSIDGYKLKVKEDCSLSTGGGSIDVGESTGLLELSTGGGSIAVESHTGDIRAKTGGGKLKLRDINGGIRGSTGGGGIECRLDEITISGSHSIELSTGGGDIRLQMPAAMKATVEAIIYDHDNKYEITSDFPLKIEESRKRRIEGRGDINGGGMPILLETESGDIMIRKR